ncbi:IS200/IS605 family transposase [Candidatus Campbellbacteria bacterium CG22_combo_CG10-13_8_21_14_all_36_13]|uniref:IS200/IS605 family transposase n=1 Tax=Candidatus Campbellbacteria bacterium CG22_combo_CG10-13_8_21_14_all_36_13 TaxID=1974529 RepID=A0A2H0DXS7_9BACT|nr:MAG: IS200/IS605 family transposase [Candidatus Campbellbacteria bacterium CG22_combo_CG10-13_8_21_14_all_36_13]
MFNYRKGSHTLFDLKYHIVWVTKYRKPILTEKRGQRVRTLVREICFANNVEIIKGHISKDYVHIFVSIPPQLSISRFVQLVKGKTSRKLLQEDKALSKIYWGSHLWARGYFATSSGTVTDEVIMNYIENQDDDKDDRSDGFTITTT